MKRISEKNLVILRPIVQIMKLQYICYRPNKQKFLSIKSFIYYKNL